LNFTSTEDYRSFGKSNSQRILEVHVQDPRDRFRHSTQEERQDKSRHRKLMVLTDALRWFIFLGNLSVHKLSSQSYMVHQFSMLIYHKKNMKKIGCVGGRQIELLICSEIEPGIKLLI
jgi:hypothetical protein